MAACGEKKRHGREKQGMMVVKENADETIREG
jgi:hypothetical protein